MYPAGRKYAFVWTVITLLAILVMLAACAAPPAAEPEGPAEAEPEEVTEPEEVAEPEEEVAEPEEEVAPPPEEQIVITFASWVYGDYWQQLADEFHELYPNVTIEFHDVPFEEMHDKLLTQVAANNPPDTAYVDSPIVGEFAGHGALLNLDDAAALSDVIDVDDYVPAFLQSAMFEGSLYGLPIDGETTGLFYRTDRFEEAGLDPTHPPETWDEFEQYAALMTNPEENKYGFISFATEAAYYFYPWLWQAGADTLNPNDPNDIIWDSEEGQAAADFYVKLAEYSPPDFLNSNSWDGRVAFANGDVAMYVAGAWFAGVLLTEFPDATGLWDAAPLPTAERCATTIAADHLVVFNATEHPEEAFKWLEYVSQPEHMAVLTMGTEEYPSTLLPPRISILDDPATYESRPYMKGFADNMQCAYVSDVIQPRFYEIEGILNEYLGQAFYGEMDGATAVIEAAKEAEEVLAE